MTQLQEELYNIIPQNFLEKNSMQELLNIFFKVIDDTCKIAEDVPEYLSIDTDVLSEDMMKIYLQNIHEVLKNTTNDILTTDVGSISQDMRKNYCYSDINLNIPSALDTTFIDNTSIGLFNVNEQEEIVVQAYFNGVDVEYNKRFILNNKTGITLNTTIDEAVLNNNLVQSELCCSSIPCAVSTTPRCSIGTNLNEYISSYTGTSLSADILNDILNPIANCKSTPSAEDLATEAPYKLGSNWLYVDFYIGESYIDNNLTLNSLSSIGKKINHEHIWSAKDFKQNLGHAKAFYFTYNIVKEADKVLGSYYDDIEYIKLEDKLDDDGNPMPFNYIIKSLINEYIYDNIIKPVAHPVGYNGVYKKELDFSFNESFCTGLVDDYDVFFVYCIDSGKYFDIRDGNGLFGDNGFNGQALRYNTEIKNIYRFNQHSKTYLSVNLENGYSYRKNFDDSLVLLDPVGTIIKTFSSSCGISGIKVQIKNPDGDVLDVVNNSEYTCTDPITFMEAHNVYRIEFNSGKYFSNEDASIYLDNNVKYNIVNSRVKLFSSSNALMNDLSTYDMLYNGINQIETQLCKEELFFDISMQMKDACIAHNLIIQEDISTSSLTDSEYLDLTLNQTDSRINVNEFIRTYISTYGNDDFISEHILQHLAPESVNLTDESLEGMDANYNDVLDHIEYGIDKQDWGWIIGADKNGTLPQDYELADINAFIINYTEDDLLTDVLIQQAAVKNIVAQVSPAIGSFDECTDHVYLSEDTNTSIYEEINESVSSTEIIDFLIKSYTNESFPNLDEQDSYIIKEVVPKEYVYVIIDGAGSYVNTNTEVCSTDVDINQFAIDYINANGSSAGLSEKLLDNNNAPGKITACKSNPEGANMGGAFIEPTGNPAGFNIGEAKDVSGIYINDLLIFN